VPADGISAANCENGGLQKKPETVAAIINSLFPTQVLLGIIGGLLGMIIMRLMGF
jgi:hypothetical protein